MTRRFAPLVRASAVSPFVRFLEEAGAPSDRYLDEAKLSPSIVERSEDLLPLRQSLAFVERAAVGQRVENLGMLVGETTDIAHLGALGRIITGSMTLKSALTTVVELINFYNSGDRIWLLQDHDPVLFCHAFVFPDTPGARQGNLYTLMLMIKIVRLSAGENWWPREIRLPKAETARRTTYEAVFPADLMFHDLDAYALVLDRPLLARRMGAQCTDPAELRAESSFLRSTAPGSDLRDSIRHMIGELLLTGYPDVRLVAENAGLSVRTLQRWLAEEDSSFSRLVDEVRFQVAVRLLRDERVKLIDIAYELGYTDAANFSRAFKRWTGASPSEYRRIEGMGQ